MYLMIFYQNFNVVFPKAIKHSIACCTHRENKKN